MYTTSINWKNEVAIAICSAVINGRDHFTVLLAILISAVIFQSCIVFKSPADHNYANEEISSSNIIFLTCTLAYDSVRQEYNMELVSKQVVSGKLKETEKQEKGDFGFRILDQNFQLISQKNMPCPLDKNIEYVDNQGLLRRKDVRLNSTEVLLRLQLTPNMYYIAFYKQDKQLLLINLKK